MATTFGTRPEDASADSRGNINVGVVHTLYPTEADALARTSPIGTATTNELGLWPFEDSENRLSLWVRNPAGSVWPVEAEGALASKANQSDVDAALALKADVSDLDAKATIGTVVSIPNLTAGLQTDFYIAHRGGAGFAPEETMEAFRTAIACGADAIEMDIQPLADGSLGVTHDPTVDRTTDGTGNVADFTAPAWRALNAAAKFPWNGKTVPPALLTEVLAEFAHKSLMMIEPKDADNADAIMDLFDRLQLGQGVILATSSRPVLQAVKARGYVAYFYWGAAIGSPDAVADIVADGADFLGLDGVNRPDAEVSALVATGKPVVPYTINRRSTKARLAALGVVGYLGDQPVYLKGSTAQRTVDSWRQGVLGHGFNVNAASPDMTKVTIASGAVTLAQQGTPINAIPGEVCPLANAAGSYTIDLDIGFGTMPASGGSVIVMFGLPDDKNKSLVNAAAFPNGYLLLIRAAGGMSLYKLTDGSTSATQIGSTVATAALTAGAYAHITITVTPTTVTAARTDGTPLTIGPVTDSTYRGGYIALGKKDVTDGTVRFKALAIT